MTTTISKHPKIVATTIFVLAIGAVSFWFGYQKDKKKKPKETKTHHFWNGMKWVGIIYAIFLLIALILSIMFSTNYWEWWLYGGDAVNSIFSIIIALLEVLSN